jgi:hypothetical protein
VRAPEILARPSRCSLARALLEKAIAFDDEVANGARTVAVEHLARIEPAPPPDERFAAPLAGGVRRPIVDRQWKEVTSPRRGVEDACVEVEW